MAHGKNSKQPALPEICGHFDEQGNVVWTDQPKLKPGSVHILRQHTEICDYTPGNVVKILRQLVGPPKFNDYPIAYSCRLIRQVVR